MRFLDQQGHSLKLREISVQDARSYVALLQGTVVKYDGHPLNHPIPGARFSPATVWSHVRSLRSFSTWLSREGYTRKPIFVMLEVPKLPKRKIEVLSPEEIRHLLEAINPNAASRRSFATRITLSTSSQFSTSQKHVDDNGGAWADARRSGSRAKDKPAGA